MKKQGGVSILLMAIVLVILAGTPLLLKILEVAAKKAASPTETTVKLALIDDALAAFVAEQKIAYRQTESAYVLEWSLPRWRAVLDGETGKVDIKPAQGGK